MSNQANDRVDGRQDYVIQTSSEVTISIPAGYKMTKTQKGFELNPDPEFYKNALPNPVSGWISVENMLPDDGVPVLVFRPDAEIDGDPIITISERVISRPHGWLCCRAPSHWMPLPAAPEAA